MTNSRFNDIFQIADRAIGAGCKPLVIAEISGNHGGSLEQGLSLIEACADAGAEMVKFQSYTPDTITLNSDAPAFRVEAELWKGQTLYNLYEKAHTPFEWHEALFAKCHALGMIPISSPFDNSAVDMLEGLGCAAYKVASCELVDFGLIRRIAATGKPVIVSSGAANITEIAEALDLLHELGVRDVCLLHCISAYPTGHKDANLATITDYKARFNLPVGFSDHTMGLVAPIAATALGACIIEKHICHSVDDGSVDSAFSLETADLNGLIQGVEQAYMSVGTPKSAPLDIELESLRFRRSLFVVEDIKAGETIAAKHIASVRPAGGLHTKHMTDIIGKTAKDNITTGTPTSWDLFE